MTQHSTIKWTPNDIKDLFVRICLKISVGILIHEDMVESGFINHIGCEEADSSN